MKKLHFVILAFWLFTNSINAQQIILDDNITKVNSMVKIADDKAILSCKMYQPGALVSSNSLELYTVNNLTNFSLTNTINNLDSNLISWSHHAIFLNKPDTITIITNYLNTTDTTVGLAVLFLNYRLEFIKKQFYPFNLPFKYPALKNTDIVPFNVKANGSKGYYGTTTIINSKNNDLRFIGAPVVEVLFDLDENLNLKTMKNIVSDSLELGENFLFNSFDLLGLMKTNNGFRLQGEHGLAFNLDSVFIITNYTYTQPLESQWNLNGQISYATTANGYNSVAIQLTDSSKLDNFPQEATFNTLNLIRLRKFNKEANIIEQKLMRVPNKFDSAEVRIVLNSNTIYENNLKLSNPLIQSFGINKKGEMIYGYFVESGYQFPDYRGQYSLILFDSALNITQAKTYYQNSHVKIMSLILGDNGNIWVSGYQTGTIPTKNYLRLITKEEFHTSLPSYNLSETKLSIYPNPANNSININQVSLNSSIKIFDLSGKLLKSIASTQNPNINIGIDDLENGIYLIETIAIDGKVLRGKFVVSR